MNAEIWFFFTSDGRQEITVLGKESAQGVAALMSPEQRRYWKCRRNRSQEACYVGECPDLGFAGEEAKPSKHSNIPQHNISVSNEEAISEYLDQDEDKAPTKSWTQPGHVQPPVNPTAQPSRPAPQAKHAAPPPPLPPEPEFHEDDHPVVARQKTKTGVHKQPKGNDKRRHQRVDLRLRVVLIAGNRSFRTYSKDISKGGMSFEHIVPKELIGQECKVIIGSSDMKENLEFEAHIAGDASNPRAIEFHGANNVFLGKLESWLAEAKKSAA